MVVTKKLNKLPPNSNKLYIYISKKFINKLP